MSVVGEQLPSQPILRDYREMTKPENRAASRRQAIDNLIMQRRVERAAKRMGWLAVMILALGIVASIASIFRRKYL